LANKTHCAQTLGDKQSEKFILISEIFLIFKAVIKTNYKNLHNIFMFIYLCQLKHI